MTEKISDIKKSFTDVSKNSDDRLLMLVCCAPCSCEILTQLKTASIDTTVLFYNPNIMPVEEYILRKETLKAFCQNHKINYTDLDDESEYEIENSKWVSGVTKGLEHLPEKSDRCQKCFTFRMQKLFEYASENNFKIVSSTLAVSIYKDFSQVRKSAQMLEKNYSQIKYWYYDWQSNDDYKSRRSIITKEQIYNQNYCGCIFSKLSR